MIKRLKAIFLSWDFYAAAVSAAAVWYALPTDLPLGFAKPLYEVGVSILSIVFSVFFAGLAILMASGDNEFVQWLEADDGAYGDLMYNHEVTLVILFAGLIASIVGFGYASYLDSKDVDVQHVALFAAFVLVSVWGLFAAVYSVKDAILYSQYRVRFLEAKQTAEAQGRKITPPNKSKSKRRKKR